MITCEPKQQSSKLQPHPLIEMAHRTAAYLSLISVEDSAAGIRERFVDDLKSLQELPESNTPPLDNAVRGLRYGPTVLAASCTEDCAAIFSAARSAVGHVNWTEFYAPDLWSRPFLPNFANGEGIGPAGTLRCHEFILGLFILGPNTLYPAHAHPAEEFYLVLTGDAEFQIGANEPFRPVASGDVAWHCSGVSHAIRTHSHPLFAVVGWRGAIHERSWYRDDMSDHTLPIRYPSICKG